MARAQREHGISERDAKTLFKHRLEHTNATSRDITPHCFIKPTVSDLLALKNDEYFHLIRFAKRLRCARDDFEMRRAAADVIDDMEARAQSLGLSKSTQTRRDDAARLPENILQLYDN